MGQLEAGVGVQVQYSTVQYSTCVRAQDGRGRGQLPGGLHHHRGVCLDVLFYDCIVVNLHVSDMLHNTHNKLIKGLFMFYAMRNLYINVRHFLHHHGQWT